MTHQKFSIPGGHRCQTGFSLIEALVAIFILAIGLLGLAFLQGQALKFNTSAYARTQASILAHDIIDRMRLNAAEAADYATTSATEDGCNEALITVLNDINCWSERIGGGLPSGTGTIVDNGDGTFTVTVTWTEQALSRLKDGATPATDPAVRQRAISWEVEI